VSQFNNEIVLFAHGKSRNFAKAENRAIGWGTFQNYIKKPYVTPEKRKEFNRLSKDDQDNLKAMAGWFSGAQCADSYRNLRNILPRNLVTIDMDYVPDYVPDLIRNGAFGVSDYEFAAHSSRRHTPDEPRIRIIIPMTRRIDRDEYTAVVRIIGHMIDPDMKWVDPVSYRPAQMMFFPTCSRDDEKHFFYFWNEADLLDPDDLLAHFEEKVGDWRDLSILPRHPDEDNLRKRADKAEDPTEKEGIVGDFCRAYTVLEVMDEFLPDAYVGGESNSGQPRFTYTGSTSSNGAIVYDDGKFIFSHHGHDPGCDMNLNAFDFLRIHKFGELDDGVSSDKKITELPSFKAMAEFAERQPPVRKERVARRYDLGAMFEDAGIEVLPTPDGYDDHDEKIARLLGEDRPAPEKKAEKPTKKQVNDNEAEMLAAIRLLVDEEEDDLPPLTFRLKHEPRPLPESDEDWLASKVKMSQKGEIEANLPNVALIIHNDPRLRGVVSFNEFTKQIVFVRSLKTNIGGIPHIHCSDPYNGNRWLDFHDTAIRAMLETESGPGKAGYDVKPSDRDMTGAVLIAAHRNPIHPVREYLEACVAGPWENVETLLIRYLGVADNAYHREVASNIMLASVARIFNPGCKFDFAPIIGGEQGIGKSSFIKVLYGGDWFGEISCKLDDKQDVAEEIAGKWGCELPELSSFHKSDHNAAKAFLRRQYDDVRMAYDRRVSEFPRQSIFWGTTNDSKVLKDPTGNRSYWMVLTEMKNFFDLHWLTQEREALWGAAVAEYMRRTGGDVAAQLDLSLQNKESQATALELQEGARTEEVYELLLGQIELWLSEPVPLKQFMSEIGKPISDFPEADGVEPGPDPDALVLRMCFTVNHVQEALGLPNVVTNTQVSTAIQKAISAMGGWVYSKKARRVHGVLGRWRTREDATPAETLCGYRLYEEGS